MAVCHEPLPGSRNGIGRERGRSMKRSFPDAPDTPRRILLVHAPGQQLPGIAEKQGVSHAPAAPQHDDVRAGISYAAPMTSVRDDANSPSDWPRNRDSRGRICLPQARRWLASRNVAQAPFLISVTAPIPISEWPACGSAPNGSRSGRRSVRSPGGIRHGRRVGLRPTAAPTAPRRFWGRPICRAISG